MTRFARLAAEFPDFDIASLPDIPAGWDDISWHNDACPCFATPNGLIVWTDYADPAVRELGPRVLRYQVITEAPGAVDGEQLLESDDWAAVLAKVAEYAA